MWPRRALNLLVIIAFQRSVDPTQRCLHFHLATFSSSILPLTVDCRCKPFACRVVRSLSRSASLGRPPSMPNNAEVLQAHRPEEPPRHRRSRKRKPAICIHQRSRQRAIGCRLALLRRVPSSSSQSDRPRLSVSRPGYCRSVVSRVRPGKRRRPVSSRPKRDLAGAVNLRLQAHGIHLTIMSIAYILYWIHIRSL